MVPGEAAVLAEIQGAGFIHRRWRRGRIPRNEEQRHLIQNGKRYLSWQTGPDEIKHRAGTKNVTA